MSERFELKEEQIDSINGGAITYTWDGTQGSLGINGKNVYKLVNKEKFIKIYNEMKADYSDAEIIKELRNQKVIQNP